MRVCVCVCVCVCFITVVDLNHRQCLLTKLHKQNGRENKITKYHKLQVHRLCKQQLESADNSLTKFWN